MKTQTFVLFITICLVGCATPSAPAPTVVKNVGKKTAGMDISWPTLESNRAAEVMINYHVLNTQNGTSGGYSGRGLVVGPHAVISTAQITKSIRFPEVLQGITIEPDWSQVSGDWSATAEVIARMDSGYGIELLITNIELPDVSSVVFSNTSPGVMAGYRLGQYDFGSYNPVIERWVQKREVEPVFVLFPTDDAQRCEAWDQLDVNSNYGISASFDMEHRLICFGFQPAQELVHFLQDNGVSVVTK